MSTNGHDLTPGESSSSTSSSDATNHLLQLFISQIIPFLRDADAERERHKAGPTLETNTALVHSSAGSPAALRSTLESSLTLSEHGVGSDGLQSILKDILRYSVNPSAPGFLDKLYAAPLPPGIAADLLLSVLNTNVHVYQVSPVLTLIEKEVTKSLARRFGLSGPRSGGINVQGGSASNLTSITIARNTLFPETKELGNRAVKEELVLFTSSHGHYSIEKAAQALGFGSKRVVSVPVDGDGRMMAKELERLIIVAKGQGKQPFYVNATAGTTVLGSFDPFVEIANIAKRYGLWFHVDAAWGGGFTFSNKKQLKQKLEGIELADSIATNPHKMLGVPVTCSFLLGQDMRQFQAANTLKAGYLFHDNDNDSENEIGETSVGVEAVGSENEQMSISAANGVSLHDEDWLEPFDLADLTLQCGRRGDSLKFFLSWQYYGSQGYAQKVDTAYDIACHLSELVDRHPDLTPVLAPGRRPSCLQVCFYFAPDGKFTYGLSDRDGHFKVPRRKAKFPNNEVALRNRKDRLGRLNSKITSKITQALIPRGFMIDFAPSLEGQEDKGSFFRVVVNISTIQETVDKLVACLVDVGHFIVRHIDQNGGYKGSGV